MYMDEIGYRNLRAAIVIQAVEDYKKLCRLQSQGQIIESGPHRTKCKVRGSDKFEYLHYSFEEIEKFIKEDGPNYTDIDCDKILKELRKERKRAERLGNRKR